MHCQLILLSLSFSPSFFPLSLSPLSIHLFTFSSSCVSSPSSQLSPPLHSFSPNHPAFSSPRSSLVLFVFLLLHIIGFLISHHPSSLSPLSLPSSSCPFTPPDFTDGSSTLDDNSLPSSPSLTPRSCHREVPRHAWAFSPPPASSPPLSAHGTAVMLVQAPCDDARRSSWEGGSSLTS